MQDTSVNDLNRTIEIDDDTVEIINLDSSQEEEQLVDSMIEDRTETSPIPPTGISTPNPERQDSNSSSSNSVAKTEPGTPICEMYSPFSRLPSQEGFAVNMSEHVAFENLPNYTGKWEEMRGLLKRIRTREKVNEGENSQE
eukprot:TRINITY_DN16017_c0_g1_i1.p2 TRINITY_DN16017_c0_g1~~TRINITY_DN16017_c0_g1_i1.p2  ORF type:complete len:141 (-),score=31.79 TRINITY_DN16017_c0_g1_i1:100-522(-)